MKNLSLFVSAFALLASSASAQTINCGTLPSCDSLGYTDTVANCPSSSEVLKCPFDMTKGKCQRGPAIGDLKYSLNTANHNGWILCNGQSLDKTTYGALFNVIGTNYGSDGAKFRVPDYRGFFLRASGTASYNNALSSFGGSANSDLKTPQKEQLPNITGMFAVHGTMATGGDNKLFSTKKSISAAGAGLAPGYFWEGLGIGAVDFTFDASKTSSVYTSAGHVIPANYAANVFIYAGR